LTFIYLNTQSRLNTMVNNTLNLLNTLGLEAFEQTQRRDTIKTAYCAANNIRLLRIKYTDFERVQELIEEFLTAERNVE